MTDPDGPWASVGDTIWIEDLSRYGVVTEVLGIGDATCYVCQVDDTGKGDWAAVPCEQASILEHAGATVTEVS